MRQAGLVGFGRRVPHDGRVLALPALAPRLVATRRPRLLRLPLPLPRGKLPVLWRAVLVLNGGAPAARGCSGVGQAAERKRKLMRRWVAIRQAGGQAGRTGRAAPGASLARPSRWLAAPHRPCFMAAAGWAQAPSTHATPAGKARGSRGRCTGSSSPSLPAACCTLARSICSRASR